MLYGLIFLAINTCVSLSFAAETFRDVKELVAQAEYAVRDEKATIETLNTSIQRQIKTAPVEDFLGLKVPQNGTSCPINGCAAVKTSSEQLMKKSPLMDAHKPLVFVSSSMPKESLKRLAYQAAQQNAILVIRGMVNGSMVETAKLVDAIDYPLEIDPKLFERFSIRQVPVFMISHNNSWHTVAGNVDLNFAIEKVSTSNQKDVQP